MTAQIPDRLVNECPGVELSGLKVYAVIVGDISANHGWGERYPFASKATPDSRTRCSALWRGYVSVYRLNSMGQLMLERFDYPFHKERGGDSIDEALVGDFWLVTKETFFGKRTYIPFVNGVVVKDPTHWVREEMSDKSRKHSQRNGLTRATGALNRSMNMHWRDIDHRLEPDVWDGLLIAISGDCVPGFEVSLCPPARLRVSVRETPVCWVRVWDDYYGYDILRKKRDDSLSIVPPISFRLADDIAGSHPEERMRRWSRHFATALWGSTGSPFVAGKWMLAPHMRWHEGESLAVREVEGIVAHEARESILWDHMIQPIPLRDMSPADKGRVKAWRKLARRGALPPVLLYWVSGLVAYVVLDGHDRLLAAQLEKTPVPFLCLDRVEEIHREAEHHEAVWKAVEMAFDHSGRKSRKPHSNHRTFTQEKANRILLDAFAPKLATKRSVASTKPIPSAQWASEVIAEAEHQGIDASEMVS